MPSLWGPSDEELTKVQEHQFSANQDTMPPVDQMGTVYDHESDDEESDAEEAMDDDFSHLCDLAESAHLVDVYHTDTDIVPLPQDFTLQETFTPNNSPRKRNHFWTA
jgi:hypothetical protein